jgi:tryptophan 2,3-dioxygenase
MRLKSDVTELRKRFDEILLEQKFEELKTREGIKLSYRAYKAAIMILLNRNEPLFQIPFLLLQELKDLDAKITQFRYRHAEMVNRMLGTKIGTGGSSGYQYLTETTRKHRVFSDLFHTSTYMIPPGMIPKFPDDVKIILAPHK